MENLKDNTNTTNQEIKEMDYLVIPNPIYDVVFRYLMQDYESAMIILSTLINEKIKKLDFQPLTFAKKTTVAEYNEQIEQKINKRFEAEKQKIIANNSLSELDKTIAINEITIKDPVTGKDVKLLHLDFAAVIEKENGEEEMVMIELQKVAMETDIFRFKQYIAENFQKKRKITQTDPDTGQVVEVELPYRLIPIFILNFKIEDEISDLVIKTRRVKTGIFTDKEMDKKNDFIDHLSYELYVVQLPYLQQVEKLDFEHIEYKQKLFALLKLFDQQAKKTDNEYRLRLFRKLFPGFLDRVIQRLQTADIDNPNLEKQMQAEDYYLKPLLQRDNKISWLLLNKKQIEKELKENKKTLEDNKKALEDKDKALEDKDKVIYQLAEILKANGISNEEIYEKTGLPIDKIKNL
jgi:phosphotransferase system IIA component